MTTAAANLLCYLTGSLTQWKVEKWACRCLETRGKKNVVLIRGNGAQHAIAIISKGHGLDLEDLATGFANVDSPAISVFTQLAIINLGILWIALLITASAVPYGSWFLIAVSGIGMLQNILVAGWKRTPSALGIPLEFIDIVEEVKAMQSLMAVERKYENLGKSMIGAFFPGNLRADEDKEWDAIAEEWKQKKAETAASRSKAPEK